MPPHALPLLILAVVLGTAVQAQGVADFYPLNDGDTWTYERTRVQSGSLPAFRGYRRVTVSSDTTIGGDGYKTARVEFLRFSQAIDSTAYCAVRAVGPETRVEWVGLRGTCEATESGLGLGSSNPVTQPYYVGGLPYEGPTRLVRAPGLAFPYALTAEGVGAVETIRLLESDSGTLVQRLLAATVSGTSYGEMPGPTAWRSFQPLTVGDRWAYRTTYTRSLPTTYQAVTVTGQEPVSGLLSFRVVLTTYDAAFAVTGTEVQFWRYRDDLGCVVANPGAGAEICRDPALLLAQVRTLMRVRTVNVGGQNITAHTITYSYSGIPSIEVQLSIAEGIGDVYRSFNSGGSGGGSGSARLLLYARVGGVEYGSPPSWALWAPPTAEEGAAADDALAVRLGGPNPTRGTVALRVVVPRAASVRIDVYDVLGRRVTTSVKDITAGDQPVTVDLAGQALGVYLVRASVPDGAQASVSVTVY